MTIGNITISNQNKSLSADECNKIEWLDTNSLGGYASSTILNNNTRKYHGLLVSKLLQPYGKFVLLSHLETQLIYQGQTSNISCEEYLNADIEPGYQYFNGFTEECFPCLHFQIGNIILTQSMMMLQNKNTLLIKFTLQGEIKTDQPITLSCRPFIAFRDMNSLTKQNSALNQTAELFANGMKLTPYSNMPTINMYSNNNFIYHTEPYWYNNFAYPEEKARGYDYLEDLFTPGVIQLTFDKQNEIIFAASIETTLESNLAESWEQELQQRTKFNDQVSSTPLKTRLQFQAMQFIVNHSTDESAIIAGYQWFEEWGRDAMISLPGLTLYSGLESTCLKILNYFAQHEYQGIIPNRIAPIKGQKDEYDTVDASLWFCWAVQQYYLQTKNLDELVTNLWPAIKNIINFYKMGTLFNIQMADNGLLHSGTPLVKVTWMDVILNGKPLTPRNGAQVEINALWYNAVCFADELGKKFEDPICDSLEIIIKKIEANYMEVFWDPDLGYLRDYVNGQEINTQIRPNQIIALALPYCLVDKKRALQVINIVQQNLLTPYGLRTLAPTDKEYHGVYSGNQTQRDSAYHNGTVWPWLLASFAAAIIRFESRIVATKILQPCIDALTQHVFQQAGLGGVSEIFDGDPPHIPRGCIQQAWSVGELIRFCYMLD